MDTITGDGGASPTVHQLLGRLAPEYGARFGTTMPVRHRQVLRKILSCRTPALGGQLYGCPECPGFHYRYHSCNDRHCPQCGQAEADEWLQRQQARLLLPVPYYLVTFTVPQQLRLFIRTHLQTGLDLLFGASARALQDLASNPRRLGAQLGMLGVLHTWSRTLMFHPHIHYLIPAGGLSPDGRRWVSARQNYLLSHRALGERCRTVFRERLLKDQPELYRQVPPAVWKTHWNVGCQAAGSGKNALLYLARYVFKTATSNRVVPLGLDGRVQWRYRESKTGRDTSIQLEPLEWMRRFLQHILPRGFARVRTFGWLHPAAKVRGNRVRALLRVAPVLTPVEQTAWHPPMATPTPQTTPDGSPKQKRGCAPHCPLCQRVMILVGIWHAGQPPLYPKRPP
jgi:hypothetical protein